VPSLATYCSRAVSTGRDPSADPTLIDSFEKILAMMLIHCPGHGLLCDKREVETRIVLQDNGKE
jgi:hypothetical protein